jgi:hypothetical protein
VAVSASDRWRLLHVDMFLEAFLVHVNALDSIQALSMCSVLVQM